VLKKMLNHEDIEAQAVVELPDRELACVTILVYAPVTVDVDLSNTAQNAFQNAEINVLRIDNNHTLVNVKRNVTDVDIGLFCNQIASLLSAQCLKTLR
jgi:hypothetical protein